ncbi:hypothetical protein [Kitasatospora sp. NPDC093806]|uniref:hypothetical protein n=1 Tax=Kitasatospora sp. NPDC093806 TaxID=3155075 RepID=UPI0034369249
MSWCLLLLPAPAEFASVDDFPDGFASPVLGPHQQVRAALLGRLPGIDLSDSAWGHLVGPTWSIELNLGSEDPVDSIMLHVRGAGDDVLEVVFAIAEAVGCRVIDISEGDFLAPGDTSGWHSFQGYRNRVTRGS